MTTTHTEAVGADFQFVEKSKVDKLISDIRSVSKSRFNSNRRLDVFDRLSQWTVNLVSLQLILIPILILSGVVKSDAYLTAYSAFAAVFILVFSVSQNAEKFPLKSHRMHECAVKLNKLRRKISSRDLLNVTVEQFEAYTNQYEEILDGYDNHSQFDYLSSEYEINFKCIGVRRYFTLHYLRLSWSRFLTYFLYYFIIIMFLFLPTALFLAHYSGHL